MCLPLSGNEADFWGFCINWFLMSPLHYLSSRSDFALEFAEIFIIKNDFPTRRVRESTRLSIDTIFFKPLNKSMGIVHYIPGLFFTKLVL
jgi:hypothetical protein